MNYEVYTTDDFVNDNDFREWVLHPTEKSDFYWQAVLHSFPNLKKDAETARKIIETLSFDEPAFEKREYEYSLRDLTVKMQARNSGFRLWKDLSPVWRVAAVLLPFLVVATVFLLTRSGAETKYYSFAAPVGQNAVAQLPDGTKVWLNASSELKFAETFGENGRNVQLKGEAFFDVTKNSEKPFTVQTEHINVKVLGTHFNVKAYAGDTDVSTTLEEGSVSFSLIGSQKKVILKPGEQIVFNKIKKTLRKHNVQVQKFLGWKNGFLIFQQTNVKQALNDIERKYKVKVEYEDGDYLNSEITATFDDKEKLEEVLNVIGAATPFRYEIEGNTVRIVNGAKTER